MRKHAMRKAMMAMVLVMAGCTGSGDDDDDGSSGGFSDDGGTGTETLRIIAALSVDEDGIFEANINVADEQSTVVTGATVILKTPDEGDLTLIEQPVGFGNYVLPPGTWTFAAGFGLDVDGGADGNAFDIGFNAPDLTAVTAPESQDTIPLAQDFTVMWDGRDADQHRLLLTPPNEYDSGWTDGDTGSAILPMAVLTTAATETLTVRRRKEMDITSGRAGSVFTAELADEIGPLGLQ